MRKRQHPLKHRNSRKNAVDEVGALSGLHPLAHAPPATGITETAMLARRFSTVESLRRIRSLEELRDHLGRNIHEGLAIEVAFLAIFTI